ncbi:MAG TPA: hypothetical protein VI756_15355 [Blastocatellia bacterium]
MNKLTTLFSLCCMALSCSSAQSLKPEDPAPLQAGINRGIADSMVGTQYWYFLSGPGEVHVNARYKSTMGPMVREPLTITLYDEKRTWQVSKTVISENSALGETAFTGKLADKRKTIISVAPPSGGLLRSVGNYEVEVTGAVQFEAANNSRDPIIRTFLSKVNNYGATKFHASGTVEASNGSSGTWKAFDPENHIYTVVIDQFRFSVKYLPGRGLVDPDDPTSLKFQELR